MSWETILMWVVAPVITSAIGAWLGYFFGRRRQKIDDIDAATATFNKIIKQLREEVETFVNEKGRNREIIENQSKQIRELTTEVQRLSKEVEALKADQKENVHLKKKISRYEKILVTHNIEF